MRYLLTHLSDVASLFGQHLRMTLIALAIALAVAMPVGILITRVKWLERPVMGLLSLLYTLPSLALLVLLPIPLQQYQAKSSTCFG